MFLAVARFWIDDSAPAARGIAKLNGKVENHVLYPLAALQVGDIGTQGKRGVSTTARELAKW